MTQQTSRLGRAGVFFLASITAPGVFAAEDGPKIEWRADLGQAQVESKSRDLLLWVQFTGSWCINCRRMDRATFLHAGVVARSRDQFVPVKLRSDEHEALAQNLGLTSLPSTVLVRPNGEVVGKYEGYIEPDTFEVLLADVLRREGRLPEQIAARKKKEQDRAVALAGYCPVRLLKDQKLVPGRPELAVEHDGRVFRFANESDRRAFKTRPDAFAPANDGRCPVSQVERGDLQLGDPRWGVVYGGHLFLFKDATDRERFVKDPERYANIDRSDRNCCSHCWTRSGLAQRPTSRFSAASPSSVLLASCPDRMDAFLAPSTLLRR